MAMVYFYRGTRAECEARTITDGQLLFETDQGTDGKAYLDVGSERITISGKSTASEISYDENYSVYEKILEIIDSISSITEMETISASGITLDDFTTPSKMYYFSNTTNPPANMPSGIIGHTAVNGFMIVYGVANNRIKQKFYRWGTLDTNDWETFVRSGLYDSTNDVWTFSEWTQYLTTKEMASSTYNITQSMMYNANQRGWASATSTGSTRITVQKTGNHIDLQCYLINSSGQQIGGRGMEGQTVYETIIDLSYWSEDYCPVSVVRTSALCLNTDYELGFGSIELSTTGLLKIRIWNNYLTSGGQMRFTLSYEV